MSNDEKNKKQMSDEKQAFIREQLAPGRRTSIKKFLLSALKVSVLAILFGSIAGLMFSLAGSYFTKIFAEDVKKAVVFHDPAPTKEPGEATPTPSPSSTPSPTPSEAPKKEMTDEDYITNYEKTLRVFQNLAEEFQASVVKVSNIQNGVDWFDNPAQEENAVGGVVIAEESSSFFVLTSWDKIKDAENIRVTFLKEDTAEAKLRGKSEGSDLAVLEVKKEKLSKKTKKTVTPAELGDTYQIQKGSVVLALGNPTGYMGSIKIGTISGDLVEQPVTDNKLELFQTDWVRTANGGGVIINTKGQVLGMITGHFDDKMENNLCTAINLSRVRSLLEALAIGEKSSYFGVIVNDIPNDYKKELGIEDGIYVSEVKSGSPALEAGIQAGDVIVAMAGRDIVSVSNYAAVLSSFKDKQTVTVKVIRTLVSEKRERKLEAVIEKK